MSTGLQRSSKRKQKLSDKFLKNRAYQNEKNIKITNHCTNHHLKNYTLRNNLIIVKTIQKNMG